MTVRLKDIAADSGVSVAAVQQILAGRGERFRASTRERVQVSAQALGYRPNINAMSLRTGRSYLIGVLLSGVNYTEAGGFFEGVQAGLGDTDYAPVCFTHHDQKEEADFIKRCMHRRVDGMIINAAVDPEAERFTRGIELFAKIPAVEVFGDFLDGLPSFTNDDERAGVMAIDRMVDAGYRHAVVFMHDRYDSYQESQAPFFNAWCFYRGCVSAAEASGISLEVRTHSLEFSPGKTYEVARQALANWPSQTEQRCGYCCFGVEQGRALVQHLGSETSMVAPQVLVYGDSRAFCDRPDYVEMLQPAKFEVGRSASKALLDKIQGKKVVGKQIAPSYLSV